MVNLGAPEIGMLGIVIFIALLAIGLPIGISMAIVGFFGIVVVGGLSAALTSFGTLAYSTVASWAFSVLPMFLLMGYFGFYGRFTEFVYDAAYKWMGRLPGGLGIATQIGAVIFGACSGSSIATTAALGKIAVPQMERYGYSKRLIAGSVAMAGPVDALIPPSALLVVYGIITNVSIGKLLIAGILPGLLSAVIFILIIICWALLRPSAAPQGPQFSLKERLRSTPKAMPLVFIFMFVFGALYFGVVTPTEAGALGAFTVLVVALMMRQMSWANFKGALTDSLRSFCVIMVIVVGAFVFAQFLTMTRLPIILCEWLVTLAAPPMVIFAGVVVLYLILGMFMDAMGVILITVPFLFIPLKTLGFDPIWFGVMVVILVEIGLLTPPVGLQTYILKGVAPQLSVNDIVLGFLPFIIVDILIIIPLLIAFPQIVLFLPSTMK